MHILQWICWIPYISISTILCLTLTTNSSCQRAGSSSLSRGSWYSVHVLLLYHYVLIFFFKIYGAEDSEDSILKVFNVELFG